MTPEEFASFEQAFAKMRALNTILQIGLVDIGSKILNSNNAELINEYKEAVETVSRKMELINQMNTDKLRSYADSRTSAITAVLSTYGKEESSWLDT